MASAYVNIMLLPILMGLGHLAPALGAVRAVRCSLEFPIAVFGMIWSASSLVDCKSGQPFMQSPVRGANTLTAYDKYKDTPNQQRPPCWIWRLWIYSLWAAVIVCTYYSGFETAITMYRFSAIGLSWATPCIPTISSSNRIGLHKPKTVLRETKSLVVAICMGSITSGTTTFHICEQGNSTCISTPYRKKVLYLAILYQFLRETACDTRDILEDTDAGMFTLPVRLGRKNTTIFLASVALIIDGICTGAYSADGHYQRLHVDRFAQTCARVLVTIGVHAGILRYPKKNSLAWGAMSLFGLLPVIWAQVAAVSHS